MYGDDYESREVLRNYEEYKKTEVLGALIQVVDALRDEVNDLKSKVADLEREIGVS